MAWLDPQCFTWAALAAEWRRKDVRRGMVRVATSALVLALLCHPGAAPTALYIDSVGVEVFLVILEIQLVVGLLLYRAQLMAFLRTAYVSDEVLGTVMRKSVSLIRYSREGMRGSFRESAVFD